jgi:O-antigen/teichoic acid export membrane protein
MKQRLINLLKRSEKHTKTDMVYLASGAFWGNFNSVILAGLSFVASILFAHFLTKEHYGTYQYILSIASLIGATTLTGMNSAITRAVARGHEGEYRKSVRYQIKASIVPFILGIAVAAWYYIHGNYALAIAFVWVAIFLPLGSAFNTWAALLGGRKMFRVGSYYGLFNNLLSSIPVLCAIYFTQDFLWVLGVNYYFVFLSSFILYKFSLTHLKPNNTEDTETLPYGTHLSFMAILGTLAAQLDSFLIFHFIGSAALAIYSFATIIPERLAGILKFIPGIAMPKLAEKTEEEVRTIIKKKIWVFLALIGVVIVGYALLSPIVFKTFFPTYTDSILLTQVYSLSFLSLAAIMLQTALTSQRKTKELYVVNVTMPIVRIILLTSLLFFFGIWGLLWAQIISNVISFALQWYLLFKK